VRDFALWKGAKPGEPSWQTDIGAGRPGWHIECSAMSMKHLGQSFDIHTGGVDLIFPHHEDELAQSEAATGEPFVGTWLHCAHLQMGGAKMAKSTGNIARVGDLIEDGVSTRAIRLALISVHYRQGLTYSDASLTAAAAALERLDALIAALRSYREETGDDVTLPELLDGARRSFEAAMDDDLNVSAALAAIFDLVREANRRLDNRALSTADAGRIRGLLAELDVVLAILPDEDADELDPELADLVERRAAARAARDWATSDRLRDELAARGIGVEDTRDGQRCRRLVEAGHG
jgi:cysteinyl-tRNA synthetase